MFVEVAEGAAAMPQDTPVVAATPDQLELVFRALASSTRREIIRLLATGGDGAESPGCCQASEVCACVFAEKLGIGAPTVSHHMKALIEAGLVTAEKRGLWVYYQLVPEAVTAVAQALLALAGCAEKTRCCD
jgi:ArsR family transcriptional regulator